MLSFFKKMKNRKPSFPITSMEDMSIEHKHYIVHKIHERDRYFKRHAMQFKVPVEIVQFHYLITDYLLTKMNSREKWRRIELDILNHVLSIDGLANIQYILLSEINLFINEKVALEFANEQGMELIENIGYVKIVK